MSDTVLRCHYDGLQAENRELCKKVEDQTFFLKAAQAESERYCEQRDDMLHDIRRALDAWDSSVLEKPRDGRLQEAMECLRETFNGIIADEINEANGGAVCRMTANGEVRGASRIAGEASSAEGATSTVVLEGDNGGTK